MSVTMKRLEQLYEGKAKIIYSTEDPDLVVQYFKDDTSAFDGVKKEKIETKGVLNNRISSRIFRYLAENGVKSHFVDMPSEREMVVKKLEIIPVEVVVRNVVAGSLAKKMGMEEGAALKEPILELFYKSDELHDPMINESYARVFGYADDSELDKMKEAALRVNSLLKKFFDERGIILVDFKLEFGRHRGEVLLGDEITPDGCRLWNKETLERMDKDRFRRDMGGLKEAYEEVLRKVME
jgi:phosphoribosylaminoimidazole-succinocarboxamide synthase